MTPARWNHAETAAQVALGWTIGLTGYLWFGIAVRDAIGVDVVITVAIYAKTYYVRVLFDRLRHAAAIRTMRAWWL